MQVMKTSYKRRIELIVLVLILQGVLVLVKGKCINILMVQV